MTNIDVFNEVTAWIFAELYSKHPLKCEFSFESLPPPVREKVVGAHPQRPADFVLDTLRWLETNGFISIETWIINRSSAEGVVLTMAGFRALSAVPSSLKPQETIGAKIADAAKDTGQLAWSKVIGELVGTAIGAAGKAMTS